MDYCTLWPDRLFGLDWSACCRLHDIAYGSVATASKAQADQALFQCVLEVTGWHSFAAVMFVGVSVFGWIFFKKKGA
jgi:hypothetical protein